MNLPELLAPAGSVNAVRAAVGAGCDAVYIGTRALSARNLVDELSADDLRRIIDFCHLRGVKVYIAVNILYTNSELNVLFDFMAQMYEAGADAFIMQDMGAAMTAKRMFPKIELHASTQTAALTFADVLYLQEAGFSRVILGREANAEQIAHIVNNTGIGIEIFAHGALCAGISGQCLMSGHIGKRSGNRGRCAQPCRQRYALSEVTGTAPEAIKSEGYLLSMKDLMTLPFLHELVNTGVKALKIEGRGKTPEYVAQVTKAYRAQLNAVAAGNCQPPTAETVRAVEQVFNRGGFTGGYFMQTAPPRYCGLDAQSPPLINPDTPKHMGTYIGRIASYNRTAKTCKILLEHGVVPGDGIFVFTKTEPHPGTNINKHYEAGNIAEIRLNSNSEITTGDAVYKSYDKQLMDELKRVYENDTRKITVNAAVSAVLGQPLTLTAEYNGVTITKNGATVTAAQNKPVSKERVTEQLSKTGGTPFVFEFTNVTVSENIFIGMSELNELRREVCAELEKRVGASFRKDLSGAAFRRPPAAPPKGGAVRNPQLAVFVRTATQFNAAIAANVNRIYLEHTEEFTRNIDSIAQKCKKSGTELFAAFENNNTDGILCRTFGDLYAAKQTNKQIALDFTFNIINSASYEVYAQTADTVCLSYENTLENIKAIADEKTEILVHGKIPVMTTKQCPVGAKMRDCNNIRPNGEYALADKTGAAFPVITDCRSCTAQILSDRPLFMLHKLPEIAGAAANRPSFFRIMLSNETADDTLNICLSYKAALEGTTNPAAQAMTELSVGKEFTYGYFFNGFA